KQVYQTEIEELEAIEALPLKEVVKKRNDQPVQQELFKDRVQLNSKVEIKYINIGKNLNVHLVDERIKTFTMDSHLQKIDIKSPLRNSLVDKAVGDTAQVGDLDNYVEVLEIDNRD